MPALSSFALKMIFTSEKLGIGKIHKVIFREKVDLKVSLSVNKVSALGFSIETGLIE